MVTKEEYGSEESYIICYYAPLIGKVLEIHYDEHLYNEYGIEWYIYRELVDVQ